MFLVLWPFIVNIVFYYFRRRKVRQIDKHIYEQTAGKKKHCLKQSLNSIRTKEMNTWSQWELKEKHANCPRIGDNGWLRWGWYLGLVYERLRGLFDSQLRHGWGTVCLKFLTMQVFGNKFKLDLTGWISSLYLAEFTAKMIITSLITAGCDNLWQCHDVQGYCSLTSFI